MARKGRFAFGILLAGALGVAGYLAWLASFGSPAPVDLLPPGAFAVLEAHDLEELSQRISGTRFAAAFAQSASREWLESTGAVRAFDAVRTEVGRISGVYPGRGSAFDLLGDEAAVGWYPPTGEGGAVAPWVAGGRLSLRAWAVAGALRLGVGFGLAPAGVRREEAAGRTLYSLPGDPGESLHVFLAGRVLVGGPDRALVLNAARASGKGGAAVTREPSWRAIRAALSEHGEIFVWVRDRRLLPGSVLFAGAAPGSAGARLRAGRTIEIDVAAEPASARPAAETAGGAAAPLPGIALLRQAPLLLLTSSGPVPAVLSDLLQSRRLAVIKRGAGTSASAAPPQPGSGYAVVVTDGSGGTGFFPVPRGVVLIGMASAAESARALPLLFPTGARMAGGAGTQALATRESFPLAGEFDLWGAAIGPQLVFATDTSLIEAVRTDPGVDPTGRPEIRSWPVSTVATVSMEKTLPLLRRWGAPLSGFVAANWPQAPSNVVRDLGLLAAVGSVRLAAGSDSRFDRAAITLEVHDLR